MVQPTIMPVMPNVGSQGEAMAGASGVVFTATDRQIIKERSGEIDKTNSFKELLERGLSPKVENEETTVQPQQDIKTLESRYREHRRMLKHATVVMAREKVEISNGAQPEVPIPPSAVIIGQKPPPHLSPATAEVGTEISNKTSAIAKELNLNPAELFDKFALEQQELYTLIYRIKELHLKRLLCSTQKEFETLSDTIKHDTLAAGKTEARDWLEDQLNALTRSSAEYKLNLIKSLQKIEHNSQQSASIKWLKNLIEHLDKND